MASIGMASKLTNLCRRTRFRVVVLLSRRLVAESMRCWQGDALLSIFDLYVDFYANEDQPTKRGIETRQMLVHVRRRWRNIVFGSGQLCPFSLSDNFSEQVQALMTLLILNHNYRVYTCVNSCCIVWADLSHVCEISGWIASLLWSATHLVHLHLSFRVISPEAMVTCVSIVSI